MSDTHHPESHAVMSRTTDGLPVPGSGAMFDAIAPRYDLLNRIMSLGVDHRWRRIAIQALELKSGHKVLDLATGTADMALLIHRMHRDVSVLGLDPSSKMLEVGAHKVSEAKADTQVSLMQGDAQTLPFKNSNFDACCIAFGIRNVPDRSLALREMARVTKPGGKIAILELGEPRSGLMGMGARFYIHHVVPRLGALLSGSREYRYLQQSIAAFPEPEAFAEQMRTSGLTVLQVRPLMFGACHLFLATPTVLSESTSGQENRR